MRNPSPLRDGNFLEMEINHEVADNCHINLVYLESPKKRTTILTERYPSKVALLDAAYWKDFAALCERARALCPAIGIRETNNLAMMKDLPLEQLDVGCHCGSGPGESCDDGDRLTDFLIWLAEQNFPTKKLTKTRVRAVVEKMGIKIHRPNRWANPYTPSMGLAILQPQTGHFWCFYVRERMDGTCSAWLTRGMNFSRPERGPFRDEREIALALRAWRRGE
jgi:hypothetical protein